MITNWYIINAVLLLLVLLDATGDAFRTKGKQLTHHIIEASQIALWFTVWALFGFHWLFIIMYLFARYLFFDITYNLITGNKWYYNGNNSLHDRVGSWMQKSMKSGEFGFIVPRAIILVWWVVWILSEANSLYIPN